MLAVLDKAVKIVGQQQRLDKLAAPLQKGISGMFAAAGRVGRRTQNALNGVWLGHPLHPVLTDLPIGFWTSSLALDTIDALGAEDKYAPAADTALGLGVLSALGAAATGLADWQFTTDEPRRVGLMHALLNSSALILNIASFILRRYDCRPIGRNLSFAGFALASSAAYLGGHLVYEDRIGVDHAAGQPAPADFTPVLAEADLPEDQPRRADAPGMPLVLVRHGGQIYAHADTCAHLGGPLSEGTLRDGGIVCPWHGSCFALEDGRTLDGPSAFPQPTLETRTRGGQIEVRRRGGPAASL
jgi:nitrite reductase/ring-hydroxylating ferredoxin subunit/uncharacterized membrane protein